MQALLDVAPDSPIVRLIVSPRLLADILRTLFETAGMQITNDTTEVQSRSVVTVTTGGALTDGRQPDRQHPVVRVSDARARPLVAVVSRGGLDRIVRLEGLEDLVTLVRALSAAR